MGKLFVWFEFFSVPKYATCGGLHQFTHQCQCNNNNNHNILSHVYGLFWHSQCQWDQNTNYQYIFFVTNVDFLTDDYLYELLFHLTSLVLYGDDLD